MHRNKFLILLVFICSFSLFAQVPSQGLVAYYPFSGNANDASGNGFDGTVYDALPVTDIFGNENGAYAFDGVKSEIIIRNSSKLDNIDRLSVCAWIKPESFLGTENNSIINKPYPAPEGPMFQYHLGITGDKNQKNPGSFTFSVSVNNQHRYVISPDQIWKPGNWYSIVGTYDGDSLKLFVNGVKVASEHALGTADRFGQDIHIGKTGNVPNAFTPGVIDEIRIYNRALRDEEIKNLYQAVNIGLMAFYPFNGNTNDESGNANMGINFGATLTTDRCGVSNSAYSFDGIDDFIQVAKDFSLPEVTVSGWIRPDVIPQKGTIFSKSSDTFYDSWGLYFTNTLYILEDIDNHNQALYTININSNWHFFVAVLTKDLVNKFYLDGILVGSDSVSSDNWASYAGNLFIGQKGSSSPGDFFSGKIDDIRIYNRELSSDEILEFYQSDCSISEIIGENEVCRGEEDVVYFVTKFNGAKYTWNYLGSGATISGNSDSILIDFSKDATGGILSVAISGGSVISKTVQLNINIINPPSGNGMINGTSEVCPSSIENYTITGIENATSYVWNYTGLDAVVNGNTDNATVAFFTGATDGDLTATASNRCGSGSVSEKFYVDIIEIPSLVRINGPTEVCQNQTVNYSLDSIGNDSVFTWNFTGTGADINGNSGNVSIYFSSQATDGELTVSILDVCDTETNSQVKPVKILAQPLAGLIEGENVVCTYQNGVVYTVSTLEHASEYAWTYSGTGATITGSSDSVYISFSENATSGNLYVTASNVCGTGSQSEPLSITVNTCELHIPNAFSPNQDGINDVFHIRGLPENTVLEVFNRSGDKLYKSDSYNNDWNGSDNTGQPLKSGTYWYVLTLTNPKKEYKGYVYLKK